MEKMSKNDNSASDIYPRVTAIIGEVLQIEIDPSENGFSRESVPEWDSVNHLRLALELEDEFDITLAEFEWANIKSIDEVKVMVEKLVTDAE
jgi:acyl carrier protein